MKNDINNNNYPKNHPHPYPHRRNRNNNDNNTSMTHSRCVQTIVPDASEMTLQFAYIYGTIPAAPSTLVQNTHAYIYRI